MTKVLIKYSEIALKGKNRYLFENKLLGNIQKSANRQNMTILNIRKEHNRIICIFDSNDKNKINHTLKNVCGIKNFSYITEVEKNIESIINHAKIMLNKLKKEGVKTINFKTKRADKQFPMLSPDINKELTLTATKLGLEPDYKNFEKIIFTEITQNTVMMYSKKIKCYGGLPTGTSGRVLVLLSGGIDSPVAAFKIMKRGCTCDFLHFHTNPFDNEPVLDTKMKQIVEKLNNFQFKSKLFLIPRRVYKSQVIGNVYPRYELIFFKHYIFKVAHKLAQEYGYDAIVCGDSLAQVASQTIENMKITNLGIDLPVFRPLLTYDKDEIIDVAREIDTYDLSIEEYKDCCSLTAKNPMTQPSIENFEKKVLSKIDINKIINDSINECEKFDIN